jgi:hypothetical protein
MGRWQPAMSVFSHNATQYLRHFESIPSINSIGQTPRGMKSRILDDLMTRNSASSSCGANWCGVAEGSINHLSFLVIMMNALNNDYNFSKTAR